MFAFLLVVHALIAAALVTFILMQKSEGGGLGMGGSPSGLMSARGAADFLTRGTAMLATAFVALSIVLAVMAATSRRLSVDTSLARTGYAKPPATTAAPPAGESPFVNAAAVAGPNSPAAAPGADGRIGNSQVPLAR